MESSQVDLTGNPAAAWKYLTDASTLGRSYELYATRKTRDASWGTLGMSTLSGSSAMRHRHGAMLHSPHFLVLGGLRGGHGFLVSP